MNSRYRYRRFCVRLCIALLALVGCKNLNRDSAWSGTWKLNIAKSTAYGGYFTVGIAPDGLVTVTNEAFGFSFRCNNTEFPNGVDHTMVCKPVSASKWQLTRRTTGRDVGTSIWEISPDGKSLTIRSTGLHPDGSEGVREVVNTRRSGMDGFAGRWQDTMPFRSHPKILEIAVDGQRLHFAYPEIGQYSDSPLDGTTVPIHGPRVQPGTTFSVIEVSSHELQTQTKFSGRVVRKGTLAISENGRVLYQELWAVENPGEKDRLVYDKQ